MPHSRWGFCHGEAPTECRERGDRSGLIEDEANDQKDLHKKGFDSLEPANPSMDRLWSKRERRGCHCGKGSRDFQENVTG